MSLSTCILRAIAGAYIANSGAGKLELDEEGARGLQEMAVTGVPQLGQLEPEIFGKVISYSELGVAASLLLPFIPNKLAGLALTGFSSGLLTMYFRNSEMTLDDGIRPSQQGTALSKDIFLLAIGLALFFAPKRKK